MNKWITISLSIIISTFVGVNAILLFSEKSTISKTVYVHEYERVASGSYEEQLPKEALLAPSDVFTVYVKEDEAIDGWLVKEGDVVQAGTELATINTTSADELRRIWEVEKEALEDQIRDINSAISSLRADRTNARNSNNSNINQRDTFTNNPDDRTLEVNINVDVDLQQDGSFAHAIAQAEQELAEVNKQLQVVEAQLAQEGAAAIMSPSEGVVSAIRDTDGRLAIDIYSAEKIMVTYATGEQWQDVQANDRVRLLADGLEAALEGVVLSVAQVPATENKWLDAYKALDPKEHTNPLAYYEVRIQPNEPIQRLPFGNNTNALIVVNEAQDAVAVKSTWLFNRFEEKAEAYTLSPTGNATKAPVTIQFDMPTISILSNGIDSSSVIVYEPNISNYRYPPAVFFPMPMDTPSLDTIKNAGWKFYLKHLIF